MSTVEAGKKPKVPAKVAAKPKESKAPLKEKQPAKVPAKAVEKDAGVAKEKTKKKIVKK